jgi:NAD(P)-dependent dehydrogenase (short-subunit alcohol dehydrogenase family)
LAARPGIASYQAAKFAIDGFSRVLQAETAPFGIRVLVVVSGPVSARHGRLNQRRDRRTAPGSPGPRNRSRAPARICDRNHAERRPTCGSGSVIDVSSRSIGLR